MNKYEEMIQKFANDFTLEMVMPESYSMSDLIKKADKSLMKDINLLDKLAYLIRNGKATVKVIEDE